MGFTQLINGLEIMQTLQPADISARQIPDVYVTDGSEPSNADDPAFLGVGGQFPVSHDPLESADKSDDIVLKSHPANLQSRGATGRLFGAAFGHPGSATGIPSTLKPSSSVISDLGDRLRPDHSHAGIDSSDTSPGKLYEKLTKAMKRDLGSSGTPPFLPDPEIERLVNPDSIFKSLMRSLVPLPSKHAPHASTHRSTHLEVPIKQQLQKGLAKVKDCVWCIMDAKGMANDICGIQREMDSKSAPPYYRRIFAILVLLEKPLMIRRFLEDKVCDGDLPLTWHEDRMYHRKDYEKKKPLGCFEGWKPLLTKGFDDTQWQVKAPYLSTGSDKKRPIVHFVVQPNAILPLTIKDRVGEGAHGTVFKVRISPGHQGFDDDPDKFFALKQLRKRHTKEANKEALVAEVMVPKLLSSQKHANIMPLLATLEQNGCYYLLFDWAEKDLSAYWLKEKPDPTSDNIKQTALWMARECAGIAGGLSRIHGPHEIRTDGSFKISLGSLPHTDSFKEQLLTECRRVPQSQPTAATTSGQSEQIFNLGARHGDIKSKNLLLDNSASHQGKDKDNDADYTIKISDFGLSGFAPIRNPKGRCTPAYAPPETETGLTIHGNSCDIWALGCLYLEFITWHFGGKELLAEFQNKRGGDGPFFSIPETGMSADTPINNTDDSGRFQLAVVKESVEEFILNRLRRHGRCSQYFLDFLDLIQTHMLVVVDGTRDESNEESGDRGGVSRRRRRQKCSHIWNILQRMYDRCLMDEDYMIKSLN